MGSVTISASYGAHGDRVGHAVAERLGLSFLDRAIPNAVARQLQLSDQSAETLDERAPSRWERIFGSLSGLDAYGPTGQLHRPIESMESFRLATETVLRQIADSTGAVILGRAAMVVLKGRADVLRVRLDGPLDARIAQVVASGIDETTARETQKQVDSAREHYAGFFYNVRQDDVRHYHLFIDSTAVSPEDCTDIIVKAAQSRFRSDLR